MLSEVWSVRCFLMWGWIGPSVLETWLCFYSANPKLITGWHFFRGSVGLTEVLRAKSDRGGDGGRGHRGEGDPSPAGHNRVSRHTGTKPAGLVVNTGTFAFWCEQHDSSLSHSSFFKATASVKTAKQTNKQKQEEQKLFLPPQTFCF